MSGRRLRIRRLPVAPLLATAGLRVQLDTAREAQEAGLPVEAAGLSVQVVMGKVGLQVQTWGLPLALQNLMNRSPHK